MRPINSIEVNKEISALPDNVCGFCYSFAISAKFDTKYKKLGDMIFHKSRFTDGKINTERRFFFEVLKYNMDRVTFVGYISDESLLNYSKNHGFTDNEIIFYPFSHDIFKNRLEVRLGDPQLLIKDRKVEDGFYGEISIIEVSKSPTKLKADDFSINTESHDGNITHNTSRRNDVSVISKILSNVFVQSFLLAVVLYVIYIWTGVNLRDYYMK